MKVFYVKKKAPDTSRFLTVLESNIYNSVEESTFVTTQDIMDKLKTKIRYKNFNNIVEDMCERGFFKKVTKK